MRLSLYAFTLAAALSLGGCASVASVASDLAVSATTATPAQAKTVGEATQATALAEKTLDLAVTSGALPPAVIAELKILVPAVHNALKKVEAANAAGNSALTALALASFNEARAALNSYETLSGVSH